MSQLSYMMEEQRWFSWSSHESLGQESRTLDLPEGPTPVKGQSLSAREVLQLAELPAYWHQMRDWVISLLVRDRWVPLLSPSGNSLAPMPAPCWDLEEDSQIFHHFVRHLPGCAVFPWAQPSHVVTQAAEHLFEALVQERLGEFPPLRLPARWPEEARTWVETHYGLGDLELTRESLRLAQDLVAWSKPIWAARSPWRTCFTLHEPLFEDWTLSFGLQSRAETSLLLQAQDIWAGEAAELARSAGHPLERPAETLLGDLGRAARILPEVAAALQERHPERAEMTLDGAARFVAEKAWLLQESGYGVRLPASLTARKPRLKLRSRQRKSGAGSSTGKLGLDKITTFSWEAEVNGQPLTPADLKRLAKAKQPLVQLKGQWVMLDPESAREILLAVDQPEMTLGEALRALPADDDSDAFDVDIEEVMTGLQGEESMQEMAPPQGLQAELRPYQRRGYGWLSFLGERGLGSCLADDMGLGKTLQLICWILRDRQTRGPGPVLLVCPTSVLGNWQRELARFAPELPVSLYYGPNRKMDLEGSPFVLTSYSLVQRDGEALKEIHWRGVVLDEAQNIKNPDALQTRAIRRLGADFRVALTGTPVENRLDELWSVMDFLNPGLLGSRGHFTRTLARPIEKDRNQEALEHLQKMVRPFLLRRLKSDPAIVPDLPAKQEIKTFCPLTSEQATMYAAILQNAMDDIESKEGTERRGLVLKLLLQLKQVCNHPSLFMNDSSPLPRRSGKLQRLEEMLAELLESNQASLIFTQFARFGEKLAEYLAHTFRENVPCLHGGLSKEQRDETVQAFQREGGPRILVLSLKAGGVGLNLTRASRVFHFDRWWNPAVENQATDRAYRLGQKQSVQVYKFISDGTLEETIDAMIESKLELATNVLSKDEGWLTELDNRALRELLTLRQHRGEGVTASPPSNSPR